MAASLLLMERAAKPPAWAGWGGVGGGTGVGMGNAASANGGSTPPQLSWSSHFAAIHNHHAYALLVLPPSMTTRRNVYESPVRVHSRIEGSSQWRYLQAIHSEEKASGA